MADTIEIFCVINPILWLFQCLFNSETYHKLVWYFCQPIKKYIFPLYINDVLFKC